MNTVLIRPAIPTENILGAQELQAPPTPSPRRVRAGLAVSSALLAAACGTPSAPAEAVPVEDNEYTLAANTPVLVIEDEPAEGCGGQGGGSGLARSMGGMVAPQALATSSAPRGNRTGSSNTRQATPSSRASTSAVPKSGKTKKMRPNCEGPEIEVKHCYDPALKLGEPTELEKGCAVIDIPRQKFVESAGQENPQPGLIYMLGKGVTGWVDKVA